MISSLDTSVSISILEKIDDKTRLSIVDNIKAISPEYYDKLINFQSFKLTAK